MKRIRELEDALLKLEARLIVLAVLVTLALASYNVIYRNALVPLQRYWAHSGPPVETTSPPDEETKTAEAKTEAEDEGAGGFGGAFGKPSADEEDDEETEGEDLDEDEDDAGGFGGAFGKKPAPANEEPDEEEGDETLGGDDAFANLPDIDPRAVEERDEGPRGGPPPEGSFAAWGVEAVNSLKIEWIDMFLRQLVIIVSFLGAALATRRRKHINIDALSKLLPKAAQRWMTVVTNTLAFLVCAILSYTGARFVQDSIEFPKELLPWADEWTFQLMFPIGFGLLALHFGVRVAESALGYQEPQAKPDRAPEPEPEPEPEREEDDAEAEAESDEAKRDEEDDA